MIVLEQLRPEIDYGKLSRLLGGGGAGGFSCATGKRLDRWQKKMQDLLTPRLLFVRHAVTSANGSLRLDSGLRLKSPKVAHALRNCGEAVCFLATIGTGIEKEIRRLAARNRTSEAYILDAIGSVAVENIVERFHNRMKKNLQAEGKTVTVRLSPGYCDWPLQEQKKLFCLLDAQKIGVGLTESCLMKPRKSISGIFGILPLSAHRDPADTNPCNGCGKRNCIARRADDADPAKRLSA